MMNALSINPTVVARIDSFIQAAGISPCQHALVIASHTKRRGDGPYHDHPAAAVLWHDSPWGYAMAIAQYHGCQRLA